MSADRHHVVIAGGGVAALESLLGLRQLARHRVEVTMLSPELQFLYRPVTVAEAFGRGEARAYPLGVLLQVEGGELIWDSLEAVDPDAHHAIVGSGERVGYDSLIVAAGAIPREPFPGALTFRGRQDVPALRKLVERLAVGELRSIAFTLPSERMWTLPVYELALLTAAYLREHGSNAEAWLVTPEEEPLELFGPAAARAIEPMLAARGIRLRTSTRPAAFSGGRLTLVGGASLYVDAVVTLPELAGPRLPGLPSDRDGFIPVDEHWRVLGVSDVYAAGDVTSFPLKQGGLATQQADAAVEAIAAGLDLPVEPKPFAPVLRGLLMTPGAPLYLRAEPQRLPRQATVAIDASRFRRVSDASVAAAEPLWWPPAKIAGRYLAPLLATARPEPLGSRRLLTDRAPVDTRPVSEAEYEDALGLVLLLAECDARWGDYGAALDALDAAEALQGSLPPEYEAKRRRWRVERMAG